MSLFHVLDISHVERQTFSGALAHSYNLNSLNRDLNPGHINLFIMRLFGVGANNLPFSAVGFMVVLFC